MVIVVRYRRSYIFLGLWAFRCLSFFLISDFNFKSFSLTKMKILDLGLWVKPGPARPPANIKHGAQPV